MANFGTDLSCTDDLSPTLATVSGRMVLAHACLRRITMTRGSAIDAPNDGLNVADWLNDSTTPADVKAKQSTVDAELLKDERVVSSETVARFTGGVITLTILIVDADGPFTLTIAVSELTVLLLSVN